MFIVISKSYKIGLFIRSVRLTEGTKRPLLSFFFITKSTSVTRNNQEHRESFTSNRIHNSIFINIVFMYMTTAIICFMSGKRKITFNSELFEKYFGTDYFIQNNENKFLYILVFFAAPIIASFAISMVQIAFSLAVKNMAGFIISMIIYIISIFDINIFLPGNGCMAQRSSLFMENGLSVSQVIIMDIIIIVITLIIQLKIISVKDIL